ncbi:MAG: hypothetical protein QM765_31655 [Myxococcales bacterium]
MPTGSPDDPLLLAYGESAAVADAPFVVRVLSIDESSAVLEVTPDSGEVGVAEVKWTARRPAGSDGKICPGFVLCASGPVVGPDGEPRLKVWLARGPSQPPRR